jgi:hypothetical protein
MRGVTSRNGSTNESGGDWQIDLQLPFKMGCNVQDGVQCSIYFMVGAKSLTSESAYSQQFHKPELSVDHSTAVEKSEPRGSNAAMSRSYVIVEGRLAFLTNLLQE